MDNPEKMATLCTQDTGQRQTKQINISDIGYTRHRTKTNKTNKH